MSWEKHPPPGELKCLWCFSHTENSSTHGSRQGWSGTQTWNFFSVWKDFTLWAKACQSDHRRSLTITDTQLIRGTEIILICASECFCSTFGLKLLLKCQKMRNNWYYWISVMCFSEGHLKESAVLYVSTWLTVLSKFPLALFPRVSVAMVISILSKSEADHFVKLHFHWNYLIILHTIK